MVAKLFNDLVTTLDIIPDNSTVDLCVNHPSRCVLEGKIRIIAKRPCVYKSLVLTVTGVSRVWMRQGSRTIKNKQVFLDISKKITYDKPSGTTRRSSLSPLSPLSSSPHEEHASSASQNRRDSLAGTSANTPRDTISTTVHTHPAVVPSVATPIAATSSFSEPQSPPSPANLNLQPQSIPSQNQLDQGVNDIDFKIIFPSHLDANNQPGASESTENICHLPSGPMKTTAGDSSIVYTVSATLVMSRKDILVNNHMSTSIPFRVQSWQDSIDWRQSEDHSFHGKRRGKVEFQFQVPKQLDLRRLQDLQFGFQASWRTLQDRLKVKEVQYYIIEEEQQTFAARTAPSLNTSIISTSATHDCSGYTVSANTWGHLRAAARLQIPQPNTVLETTAMPWPHSLSVSHKLRVLIKFDQTLAKERDLQLSFPISIHPTLNDDGAPVHPEPNFYRQSQSRSRRRTGRALYGIEPRHEDEEGDSEDDEFPLPMYSDRDSTLLLMVGQEIQEVGLHVDALGVSMGMSYPDRNTLHSPSEASMSSMPNSPTSPDDPFGFSSANAPIQGEQHAWSILNRSASLTPASSAHPTNLSSSLAPRRHSAIEQASDRFLPPPYMLSSLAEEPSTLAGTPAPLDTSSAMTADVPHSSTPPESPTDPPYSPVDDAFQLNSILSSVPTAGEHQDCGSDDEDMNEGSQSTCHKGKGKGKDRDMNVDPTAAIDLTMMSSSSSSTGYYYSGSALRSSTSAAGPSSQGMTGLLTPPYEAPEMQLSYSMTREDVRSLSSSSPSPSTSSESSSLSSESDDPGKHYSLGLAAGTGVGLEDVRPGYAYSYSFASAY